MTGKSAVPDFKDLNRMRQIKGRFIKQAMAEPGSHHRAYGHIDRQLVKKCIAQVFIPEYP